MNPIFRMLYRLYRILSWSRYHLSRRLTRAGWAVVIGAAVTAATGLDTDNTVAYQAFALLLLLLAMSVLFSFRFGARFSANRLLPRFGTAGQPLQYRILLRNLTGRAQDGLMLLENLADPRPAYPEWLAVQVVDEKQALSSRFRHRRRTNPFRVAVLHEAVVPPIAPGGEVAVTLPLVPLRRGILRFTGVTVARVDPMGLVRALAYAPAAQSMLILPKRYPLPPIALPGAMKYQEGGVALASNIGQSDEFVALREYRRGDPLRHIHWRSWAKTGKPIVKEFEDEFFVRHALVLDTFTADPRSALFEEAVSVAASFACTVVTQESLLDLLFCGAQAYCFTAGRGLGHADQMLEVLAAVRPSGDRSFAALQTLVLEHATAVSGCICVFLAWDEPRRELVRKLQALGVPLLVLVLAEPLRNAALDAGPMLNDLEHFHVLEPGRVKEGLAKLS